MSKESNTQTQQRQFWQMADDTRIPIKSKGRKGSTYNGYLWVYLDKQGNVVFDFTPTRSREGPILFIGKDYTGKVHADAYSGYDELFRVSKATEAGCNASARRKFEYALDSDPVRAAPKLDPLPNHVA